MFSVEGYRMFSGILKVKPHNKEPYRVMGVFCTSLIQTAGMGTEEASLLIFAR